MTVSLSFEKDLTDLGFSHIAGVDEAGRGPLAGPVVAAAVIFPAGTFLPEVDDSKRLSAEKREVLYQKIIKGALAFGVGEVDVEAIDRVNIGQASLQAMRKAVEALSVTPDLLLIDGNIPIPGMTIKQLTVIGGDAQSFSIASASILAKVTRDRIMEAYEVLYPGYGFSQNKGYGTRSHREALKRLGPCEIHRRSFSLFGP